MPLSRSNVYSLSFTIEDRDKNKSTMQFFVDIANTMVEIETAITTYFIPRIQAITNGIVVGWTVTTSAEDNSSEALAPEFSDVQRKGVFSFRALNGASYVVSVPSFLNTYVVDRTNVIDTSAPAVAGFIELVTSPTLLALVRPRTYLNSDITRLEKAEKHHRASTRG